METLSTHIDRLTRAAAAAAASGLVEEWRGYFVLYGLTMEPGTDPALSVQLEKVS